MAAPAVKGNYKNITVHCEDLNNLFQCHLIDKRRVRNYHQRFGQRFLNQQENVVFPELYYEKEDAKAYKLIMEHFNVIYD